MTNLEARVMMDLGARIMMNLEATTNLAAYLLRVTR